MDNKKLEAIYARLEHLNDMQFDIHSEIVSIREELDRIKNTTAAEENTKTLHTEPNNLSFEKEVAVLETTDSPAVDLHTNEALEAPDNLPDKNQPPAKKEPSIDFERFIGENLLNKIGILVLVIGVGIGVKYAIDRDLLSPLVRILNGYGVGIALLIMAIRLKAKYHDFSAVLLSGAMAVFYFITFAAHSFYNLIPQLPTFGIMVLFTLFTVFASVRYNRQITAHLGLVGAYAVPFLLNKEPGNLTVFFSYIALLNLGILALAFQRSWKTLFYSAFAFTWFIVISWCTTSFSVTDANVGLFFGTVFFITFYVIFLAQKLLKEEALDNDDLLLIISNAFIYFGLGYFILNKKFPGQNEVLSFFTVANAAVHLAVAALLFLRRQEHKGLFRMVVGLAITFLTIAIPIQLDGYWVTLLWAAEAALLLWLSGKEKEKMFEIFSFVLVVIAIGSFVHDWQIIGRRFYTLEVFLNSRFVSNILFMLCFIFMTWLISKNKTNLNEPYIADDGFRKIFYVIIPATVFVTSFLAFSMEVDSYFKMLQRKISSSSNIYSAVQIAWSHYNLACQINLLIFFTIFWSIVNHIKTKNRLFGTVLFSLGIIIIVVQCIPALVNLGNAFQPLQSSTAQFEQHKIHIIMRYINYGFMAMLLLAMKKIKVVDNFPYKKLIVWEYCLIATLIVISSSELINIAALTGASNAYKMGLTILWAVCSLTLIALGIFWNRKDYRIAAIVLFGIVLIKLFFYDLVELETIPKTIVFILIGVLLLIISFLYNKFKGRLYNE